MDELERQVEALYERIQLRPDMAERLNGWLESELIDREDRNAAERDFQTGGSPRSRRRAATSSTPATRAPST